jgi:hypothetical protein
MPLVSERLCLPQGENVRARSGIEKSRSAGEGWGEEQSHQSGCRTEQNHEQASGQPTLGMGFAKALNRADNTGGRGCANQIKLELLAFAEILRVGGAEKWQVSFVVA